MSKDRKKHAKLLGVPLDAGTKLIRRAYRKLALQKHPDKNAGSEAAKEEFQRLSESYQFLLKNPAPPAEDATVIVEPSPAREPAEPKKQRPNPPPIPPEAPKAAPGKSAERARERIREKEASRKIAVPKQPSVQPRALAGAVAAVAIGLVALLAWNSRPPSRERAQPVTASPVDYAPEMEQAPAPAPAAEAMQAAKPKAVLVAPPEPERELFVEKLPPAEIDACVQNIGINFTTSVSLFASETTFTRNQCHLLLASTGGELLRYQIDLCSADTAIEVTRGDQPDRQQLFRSLSGDCPFGAGSNGSEFARARREIKALWEPVVRSYAREAGEAEGPTQLSTSARIRCGRYLLHEALDRCEPIALDDDPRYSALKFTRAGDKLDCEIPIGKSDQPAVTEDTRNWLHFTSDYSRVCHEYAEAFLEAKVSRDPKHFLQLSAELSAMPARLSRLNPIPAYEPVGGGNWGVADPIVAAVRAATNQVNDQMRGKTLRQVNALQVRVRNDATYLELRYAGRGNPSHLAQLRGLASRPAP